MSLNSLDPEGLLEWLAKLLGLVSPGPPKSVPVFVMLPLDTWKMTDRDGSVSRMLDTIAGSGARGVMVDIWWGICEETPGIYDFSMYKEVMRGCAERDLEVQAVMSFHACGGSVGDDVDVPLPMWVVEKANEYGMWFLDRAGMPSLDYLSLGADELCVLPGGGTKDQSETNIEGNVDDASDKRNIESKGDEYKRVEIKEKAASKEGLRTPVDAYGMFVGAFVEEHRELLGRVITELQIGLGPCGELRYPSYSQRGWQFPGIGEFQCFDQYMLDDWKIASSSISPGAHERQDTPEDGQNHLQRQAKFSGERSLPLLPPSGTGSYNERPWSTDFFTKGYKTEAGRFFLTWYSEKLLEHGERVLSRVRDVLASKNISIELAAKIAGIHWWHLSKSRAAEATCGYMRGRGPAYGDIAALFKRHGCIFDFTCLEMWTWDQPFWKARAGPEQLVASVIDVVSSVGVKFAGENALGRFDEKAYRQIEKTFRKRVPEHLVHGFTYLRYCRQLVDNDNYQRFSEFVGRMKNL